MLTLMAASVVVTPAVAAFAAVVVVVVVVLLFCFVVAGAAFAAALAPVGLWHRLQRRPKKRVCWQASLSSSLQMPTYGLPFFTLTSAMLLIL